MLWFHVCSHGGRAVLRPVRHVSGRQARVLRAAAARGAGAVALLLLQWALSFFKPGQLKLHFVIQVMLFTNHVPLSGTREGS